MATRVRQYKLFSGILMVVSILCCHSVSAKQAQLKHAAQTLSVDIKSQTLSITVSDPQSLKLQIMDIQFNHQSAQNWRIAQNNEHFITLQGEFSPSVSFYRTVTDNHNRLLELTISKIDGGFHLQAHPEWARQVTLTLKDLGSHIFGLSENLQPDNRLSPDLRHATVHVDVNAEDASFHENYASAYSAFYMSSLGYGAFFDTFARGTYDIAINGQHRIQHDSQTLDWYLFFGDNGAQIHQAYYALIGQPKALPIWGLGPIGWRDQNDGGASELLNDIHKLSELKIPFTAWFVDRPYSNGTHGWSDMDFSPIFAQPAQWIEQLRQHYGLEFMTWTTPAFFGATPFATHLAGDFSYLDVSDPISNQAFKTSLINKQLKLGVKGHKIDRADEGFPVYESWQDTRVLPAYRRNQYTYLMTKMHDEALRSVWGDDQLTFTRSAIHRSQPYLSAIWAGDPRTTWEGLQANFANAARSSFMGFPVWGTDVGGYQGEGYIPEALYIRWLQAGSMAGLFEIKLDGAGGDGRDRMPWQYSETIQKQFKAILDERMTLLPYLYSLARTSADTGTLMQPLAYRHLDDSNTYAIWDEFYLGDAILVAPIFTAQNKRSVYLPKGEWRDFDDATQRFKGGQRIDIEAPLNKFPRFVKANSIYVSGNLYQGNDRLWQTNSNHYLTIHAFPGKDNETSQFWYVDARQPHSTPVPITLQRKDKTIALTSPALPYARHFKIVLDSQPQSVRLNNKNCEYSYNQQTKMLTLQTNLTGELTLELD